MKHILDHVIVFALTLVVDMFWARYTLATSDRLPVKAGLWSMAIVLGGTFSMTIWLDNRWTVLSSAAGAFVGTWAAVRSSGK